MDSIAHFYFSFDGILCSGLTEKTKLSFTSSNSSFSDCVRTQQFKDSTNSDHCSTTTSNNQVLYDSCTEHHFSSTKVFLSTSTIHSFTHCIFTNMYCTDDKAGAISCTQSSTVITLHCCTFESCSSIDRGGAVFVSGDSNTLTVTDSLFHNCIVTEKKEEPNPGGGGICMSGSLSCLDITSCTFLTCQANVYPRGGGGFFASQIKNSHTSSSQFIDSSTDSSGGAIFFWELETLFSLSDSLFSGNSAKWGGGAIRAVGNPVLSTPRLMFSFFTANTAPQNHGSDLSIDPKCLTSPFLHSFSTTASNRAGYHTSTVSEDYSDWLPQGSIDFINLTSERGMDTIEPSYYTWLDETT